MPVQVSEKRGTWFAVLSGLMYGLLGYFGMTLMNTGMSIFNMYMWRFLISAVFLIVIMVSRHRPDFGTLRDNLIGFALGAIFYGAPSMLYFFACKYISTGQAMVIFFVYPVFVMLLNWLWNGQPLKSHYFLAFALILLGLIFLVDITEISFDFMGIGFSLLSALGYGIYIFLSKKVILPPLSSSLMVSIGCVAVSALLASFDHSLAWPVDVSQWIHIIGFGIIATAIPILLLLEALKHISSDKASLVSVLEPLFTVFVGVLFLDEVMRINHVIGIILVLLGAMTVNLKFPIFALSKFRRRT